MPRPGVSRSDTGSRYVSRSFVRRASDVQQLQAIIHHLGGTQPIIAKIEHPTALSQLGEILDVDGRISGGGLVLSIDSVTTHHAKVVGPARAAQDLAPAPPQPGQRKQVRQVEARHAVRDSGVALRRIERLRPLADAVQEEARKAGIPYQRFIRLKLEQAVSPKR